MSFFSIETWGELDSTYNLNTTKRLINLGGN